MQCCGILLLDQLSNFHTCAQPKGVNQMITKLSIKNFKSIKELDIDCARVNLFIGEPNTGKSSILEALGLLSWSADTDFNLGDYVRFEYMENLFYDNSTKWFSR